MMKKTGLGRNLNSLLSPRVAEKKESDLRQLPVEFLKPGVYQPRSTIKEESIYELAESIKSQGIIQPIVVRPLDSKTYEIIAGERRWRAAQRAGLKEVPVIIRETPNETAMAIALIENIQREDLNPMEEARALHRLMTEFSLTHQEVATNVGKSRVTVTNLLRLMQLQDEVKKWLENGDLEMGHARALLSLTPSDQIHVAKEVIAKRLSVRQTESYARKFLEKTNKVPEKTVKRVDPNIIALQNKLSERLSAKVTVNTVTNTQGQLIIHYHSLDELQGILDHIK